MLNAWRQNWNLLPDGALGSRDRDKLDLNYDELYGKQDLKDLADDASWFPEEDMEKGANSKDYQFFWFGRIMHDNAWVVGS